MRQRASEDGLDLKLDMSAVIREITAEDRENIYHITEKLLQGVAAGQPRRGFYSAN